MKQYLDLLRHVRQNGVFKSDRTGTGTYSVFGHQMRFDLSDNKFPLVTTKKCHLKSIIHELLWFLKGDTNVKYLKDHNVSIWDEWVKEGTAEYRPLTIEELKNALVIHFKERDVKNVAEPYILEHTENDYGYFIVDGTIRFVIKQSLAETMIDRGDLPGSELALLRAVSKHYGLPTEKLVAGELGPVYGAQWRSWPAVDLINNETIDLNKEIWDEVYHAADQTTYAIVKKTIDQITNLIDMIKKNPDSRRLIVSAWNPALVDEMALPPCHALFQFYSNPLTMRELDDMIREAGAEMSGRYLRGTEGITFETTDDYYNYALKFCSENDLPTRKLSCQLYQRSADCGLGVPFNIASYALLTMMVAQVTNHVPGEFIWTGGDCHIYSNHLEQIDLQLTRTPLPLPTMKINPDVKDIFDFKFEDFELVDYEAHPHIAMPVAV